MFLCWCHGTRTRFKDTAKHYMKICQIDINAWELLAAARPFWCRSIYQATAKFERNSRLHEAETRLRRKEREMSQHLHVSLPYGTFCPHRNKICISKIGLLSPSRTHDRPLDDVILVSADDMVAVKYTSAWFLCNTFLPSFPEVFLRSALTADVFSV